MKMRVHCVEDNETHQQALQKQFSYTYLTIIKYRQRYYRKLVPILNDLFHNVLSGIAM
jgi:hypothetical protein